MVFFLAIIVVILIFLFYRRTVPPLYNWQKYTLILLRSITTVILVLLLLNPILYFIRNKLTRPQFIILKDNSASMVNSEINKYDLLAASYDLLSRSLKKSKYEIQEYDFADGLNGNPERTYLSKTLHEIINRYDLRDLKGILLLSDGWFKDEELSIFNEYFIPLYTYLPDYRSMDFDLELTNLHYNKKAYRQEMTPIIADIRSQNYQGKAVVEFLLQGKIEHSQRIDFQSDPYQQITLEHEFRETGLQEFTIRIMADSTGEHNMDNNLFPAAVQVVNNRSRVIILSDRLNWDIKFMIDALRSQPRWEINFILKTDVFMIGKNIVDFPDMIKDSALLIIMNQGSLHLNKDIADLIRSFVAKGGGIILQGQFFTELQDLFPASPFKMKETFSAQIFLTTESKGFNIFDDYSPASIQNIPPLNYYYINPEIQARVLARFQNDEQSPAIVYNRFEQGKILYLPFFNLWKWQLWDSGSGYQKLITDLIMWIGQTSSERFHAFTDRNIYLKGDEVQITLNAYDETLSPLLGVNVRIMIRDENGKVVGDEYMNFEEDQYQCRIENLEPGNYTFTVINEDTGQTTEGEFLIDSSVPESRDMGFNIPMLKFLAKISGGKAFTKEDLTYWNWEEEKPRQEKIRFENPIYRKWYIIALFLVSFCLEIFLRKRWGLL